MIQQLARIVTAEIEIRVLPSINKSVVSVWLKLEPLGVGFLNDWRE